MHGYPEDRIRQNPELSRPDGQLILCFTDLCFSKLPRNRLLVHKIATCPNYRLIAQVERQINSRPSNVPGFGYYS
jgi:hypothetical protein